VSAPRVLDLPGPPRERGAAHGEAQRDVFAAAIDRWYDSLPAADPREWVREFLAATDFRPAFSKWTPDLLDEIAGIAHGAGIDEVTAFAYQLVDEQWCYARVEADHCSVVGSAGLIAQNLDLPDWWNGSQVVLRVPAWQDQPGFACLTGAGFLAMNGINDEGVAVVVNALPDVPSASAGLPVVAGIRGVLARRDAPTAGAFLREVDHASGQHYLVGDASSIVALECDAEGVADAPACDGVVVHTNHAVARPSMFAEWGDVAAGALANSTARLDFLAESPPPTGVDDIKKILSDETVPIRRVPTEISPASTFASTIFELSDPPALHVRGGTGETEFYRVSVS